MSSKKDTTDYLLRDIPRDFWKDVKSLTYDRGISIRDFLMGAMKDELEREKSGKKDNETSEDHF